MNKVECGTVRIENGRLMLTESQKLRVKELASKSNGYVQAIFKSPFRPRTTGRHSQGNRFNGFVAQIATQTGDEFERLKMELKQRAISIGYPAHYVAYRTSEGVLVEMTIAKSESESSVEECSLLIQVAEKDAAEKGVTLEE